MNANHIESKFAAMGARLKVREIASRWRQGDRSWVSPRDFAVDIQRFAQVGRHAEFEELTVAIAPDVHGEILGFNPGSIALTPARRDFTHLQARTHRGELGLNVIRIHRF